ncbi:MAG TPA: transcriptional regulator [Psychromonas hadalis]|nr:transcriptional regulator [Psychromonas hadalis]
MSSSYVQKGMIFWLLVWSFSFSSFAQSDETPKKSPLDLLMAMQQAYQHKNYELIYIDTHQEQLEPKQLLHGVFDGKEARYFRLLNGLMHESLQFDGKTSYFRQGGDSYSLEAEHDLSVFSNVAYFDFSAGQNFYDYKVVGSDRIAGKQAITIKMTATDNKRYHYLIWLDLKSDLPLKLETLDQKNRVLEQTMVISLVVSKQPNPWLAKVVTKKLPETTVISRINSQKKSQWKLNAIPAGFRVIKEDQHKVSAQDKQDSTYILLSDDLTSVSIYISSLKASMKAKTLQRGALTVYSGKRKGAEVTVIGNVSREMAVALADSIEEIKK